MPRERYAFKMFLNPGAPRNIGAATTRSGRNSRRCSPRPASPIIRSISTSSTHILFAYLERREDHRDGRTAGPSGDAALVGAYERHHGTNPDGSPVASRSPKCFICRREREMTGAVAVLDVGKTNVKVAPVRRRWRDCCGSARRPIAASRPALPSRRCRDDLGRSFLPRSPKPRRCIRSRRSSPPPTAPPPCWSRRTACAAHAGLRIRPLASRRSSRTMRGFARRSRGAYSPRRGDRPESRPPACVAASRAAPGSSRARGIF